jgi:hypothetical protein
MPNNVEIAYRGCCKSHSQAILHARKSDHYYVPELCFSQLTYNTSSLQDKFNRYLSNKMVKFKKYATLVNDNELNNIVYNISSFRNKFNEYLVNKAVKLISNNIEVVYNMVSFQNKFDEYLINKIGEFMSNNIETVYKTCCKCNSRGILDIRKPGYYCVSEFYLSQQSYNISNLQSKFNKYLDNKIGKFKGYLTTACRQS